MPHPIKGQHKESATAQGNGTTSYYWDMKDFAIFSIQIDDTAGAAGDNTYTLHATAQDDGTVPASCTYVDVTNALTGNANYTADSMLIINTPVAFRYIKVQVERANDGGNTDGSWTIYCTKSA